MIFSQPFTEVVRRRYSCRSYDPAVSTDSAFSLVKDFISSQPVGPFEAPNRFVLVQANGQDRRSLRGLGTYGAIKDAPGFIIGLSSKAPMDMEDFGYRMEMIILKAADLNLGTCWLGGSFTRSSFSQKAGAARGETLPAVTSVGFPYDPKTAPQVEQTRKRMAWNELFFKDDLSTPLTKEEAGLYIGALEMVRLAPSARNLQPWRIVKQGKVYHFFMQRYKGYRELVVPMITGIADLQRVDMGIALAHFDSAAQESGLSGHWIVKKPDIKLVNNLMEYSFTWVTDGQA
jgi:nitroreductase